MSLILQAHWFADGATYGNNETMEAQVKRYAKYFALPSYQKVEDRPLVFMLGGSAEQLDSGLKALRAASLAAGAGDPYLVLMGSPDPLSTWKVAQQIGAQAVSAYNTVQSRSESGSSYASNMAFSKQMWESGRKAGIPVIPTASAGWDPRPRELIPLPWGNVSCHLGPGNCYMEDPTMPQLTQAVTDSIDFAAQPGSVPLSLISAWNENDEGHWIIPSLEQGDEKLQAVKKAILG